MRGAFSVTLRRISGLSRACDGALENLFELGDQQIDLAKKAGLGTVRWLKDNGDGFATYEIDLAAKQQAKRRR